MMIDKSAIDETLNIVREDFQTPTIKRNVLQELRTQKLIGYYRLYQPCENNVQKTTTLASDNLIAVKYREIQNKLSRIHSYAVAYNLNYTVIKGIALNYSIYGEKQVRLFGDLDLLIKEKDVQYFHEFILKEGYIQKRGYRSLPMNYSVRGRARLALQMPILQQQYTKTDVPVKSHLESPEYVPYSKDGNTTIELHTGAYFLPKNYTDEIISNSAVPADGPNFFIPTISDTFIVLIATAYENSESLESNLFDHNINLRDYVDLRFFFKKYRDSDIWNEVYKKIKRYHLEKITGIVLGNLWKIYGRDVSYGCLKELTLYESDFDVDILERLKDPAISKGAGKRRYTALIRERCNGNIIKLLPYEKQNDPDYHPLQEGTEAPSCNLKLILSFAKDSIVVQMIIPREKWNEGDKYLYQLRFIVTDRMTDALQYKVDYGFYEDGRRVYGRLAKRLRNEAIKKHGKNRYSFSEDFKAGERVCILTEIPLEDIFERETSVEAINGGLVLSFDCFEHYLDEIYRRTAPERFYQLEFAGLNE